MILIHVNQGATLNPYQRNHERIDDQMKLVAEYQNDQTVQFQTKHVVGPRHDALYRYSRAEATGVPHQYQ